MNDTLLAIIALVPVVYLIVSLGVFKVPAHKACTITLGITVILAVGVWKMGVIPALLAAVEGILLGLWPIMIVIIAALFTYNLALHTKSMDTIKNMLSNITTDRRIQVLILAWGFGGFLEAVAGYGTAVAIPASILAALGFEPVFAAVICLIANTVPTAFGAVGIPVTTLAKVANLDVNTLSFYTGLQLTIFIILIPLVLVIMTTRSIKGLKGVTAITLMSGISFAVPQLFAAKFLGPELPALIGSILSLGVTIFMVKKFHRNEMAAAMVLDNKITLKEGTLAWLPYILIFVLIIITSPLFPAISEQVGHVKTSIMVYNGQGAKPTEFKWISTPGTLIIIAATIGGLIQGAKFSEIVKVFILTVKQLSKSIVTVLSIVALAKVMGYSGMISSIAVILVKITGRAFPLISPVIGALGTFITGSDTSANVLFGPLQTSVANSINVSPYWLAAANTAGATAGKMISPQSIAIATSATGLIGQEGRIFNKTVRFCMAYVIVLGILIYFGSSMV
ncbi:L-lactate permease [Fonticella tunisiensis]|uniref:L-lactate permease n=1 Tax=Fonticella tunisiensis TaxID=1096341 RepID=A0A4R7KAP5_9CLOT|nr:L-lactate permease [Fonticella tunisiensis]TDT51952.1 lactate permease [Fonticella tunisiensis]